MVLPDNRLIEGKYYIRVGAKRKTPHIWPRCPILIQTDSEKREPNIRSINTATKDALGLPVCGQCKRWYRRHPRVKSGSGRGQGLHRIDICRDCDRSMVIVGNGRCGGCRQKYEKRNRKGECIQCNRLMTIKSKGRCGSCDDKHKGKHLHKKCIRCGHLKRLYSKGKCAPCYDRMTGRTPLVR